MHQKMFSYVREPTDRFAHLHDRTLHYLYGKKEKKCFSAKICLITSTQFQRKEKICEKESRVNT